MARRGRSVRVDTGIFQDATGYRVVASFRTTQHERRYPFGTELDTMRAWQIAERRALRRGRVLFQGPAGSLALDVTRYLGQTKHLAGWKSRRSELHAWTQALDADGVPLGPQDRRLLSHEPIRFVVSTWLSHGVAPKTVRNRLIALASLYHTLDAVPGQPRPPSPTDGVTVHVPKRRPAYVPASIVTTVEENLRAQENAGRLRDAKTRARFMVMASTGLRPAQIRRLQPTDIDLERRTLLLPGAKGGEPIGLWLNADMLAALTLFVQADAWGAYDTRSMARVLRHAGWPATIRPYNARHAVGQDLAEQGDDHVDIAAWLGHSDPETTRRFYVPILTSRLRKMSERLEGRLGWTVPQPVPQLTNNPQGKSRKSEAVNARRRTTKTARSE